MTRRTSKRSTLVSTLALLGLGTAGFAAAGLTGFAIFVTVFGFAVLGWSRAVARLRTREDGTRSRRAERERLLAASPSELLTLAELTRLVDEIERREPEHASRFDLEGLLDRHANLAIAHEQAVRAASMTDRDQLERIRESCRADPSIDPRRRELAERRIQCHDACKAVVESIADELAVVAETIRLIAQRVACPDVPGNDDLITRQLAELDETDAARRELAQLCEPVPVDEPPARAA